MLRWQTCDLKRSSMSRLHGKETGCGTAPFYSSLISADLWQLKVLWLIWSVPETAMTHIPFPVSGCHVSLLVKTP